MATDDYEGNFINEETGQEINVHYQKEFVFITEYRDGVARAKYIFDTTKRSPDYIIDFIKSYGVIE